MPSISIIQVCRDKNKVAQSNLENLKGVDQVFVVESDRPSCARNGAIKLVRTPFILFLDDDCVVEQSTIDLYLEHLKKPDFDVIGGPALIRTKQDKTRLHALLCSSFFLFGPSRSRYVAVGKLRQTCQKELILCNLAFKTTLFDMHAPFQKDLFPGEENELLERLSKKDVKLYYDPKLLVTRSMTASSQAFVSKIFRYAYNRSRFGKFSELYYYIPIFFILMILTTPFFLLSNIFMAVYGLCVIGESFHLLMKHRDKQLFFLSMMIIPGLHLAYGAGLIIGRLLLFSQSLCHFFNTRYRINMLK